MTIVCRRQGQNWANLSQIVKILDFVNILFEISATNALKWVPSCPVLFQEFSRYDAKSYKFWWEITSCFHQVLILIHTLVCTAHCYVKYTAVSNVCPQGIIEERNRTQTDDVVNPIQRLLTYSPRRCLLKKSWKWLNFPQN